MPSPKDARRLNPDPDNEPNFYSISEHFPVPEQTSRSFVSAERVIGAGRNLPATLQHRLLPTSGNLLLPQLPVAIGSRDSTSMSILDGNAVSGIGHGKASDVARLNVVDHLGVPPTLSFSGMSGLQSALQSNGSSLNAVAIMREMEIQQLRRQQQQLLFQQQLLNHRPMSGATNTSDALRMQVAFEQAQRQQQVEVAKATAIANLLNPPVAGLVASVQLPFMGSNF
jgi:hypothetical protein